MTRMRGRPRPLEDQGRTTPKNRSAILHGGGDGLRERSRNPAAARRRPARMRAGKRLRLKVAPSSSVVPHERNLRERHVMREERFVQRQSPVACSESSAQCNE
jgi:hypothetical protein